VDEFLTMLNGVSVPTRYPDDLQRIMAGYSETRTREMLTHSRKALSWIKAQL